MFSGGMFPCEDGVIDFRLKVLPANLSSSDFRYPWLLSVAKKKSTKP